jgi:hypothetical protein
MNGMLTLNEIAALGANLIDEAKALQAKISAAKAKINAHNAVKGATYSDPGRLTIALGGVLTAVEQLTEHAAALGNNKGKGCETAGETRPEGDARKGGGK